MLTPLAKRKSLTLGLIFKTPLMADALGVAETGKGKLFRNNLQYEIKLARTQINTNQNKELNVCPDSLPASNNNHAAQLTR